MESKSSRDGYIRRIKEIIEKRGEIPSIIRFHYWTERPTSFISQQSNDSNFTTRLLSFLDGKSTPKYIEMLFGDALVEITEYEAVIASKQITLE